MTTLLLFYGVGPNGEGVVITREPVECSGCHAVHFFFINRGGHTRCVGCEASDSPEPALARPVQPCKACQDDSPGAMIGAYAHTCKKELV